MSLPHAILGFLQLRPMTGYELKTDCFDDSVAHFWPADQAQIYRTLDKLGEQGLVESKLEVQQERPNRKVYSITEAGKNEFDRWLHTPQNLPIHREPFLIQMFFAAQLNNAEILSLVQGQLQAHQSLLKHYKGIQMPTFDDPVLHRIYSLAGLTLEFGKRLEQHYIDWLEAAASQIKDLPEDEAKR